MNSFKLILTSVLLPSKHRKL